MITFAYAALEPVQLRISIAKEAHDLVESLSAYAWPLVVVGALFFFRHSIAAFLRTISMRVGKLELGPLSLDLPEVKEVSSESVMALKTLKADEWQESSRAWFKEFSNTAARSEYAVLNLGDGLEWITSRLFIFAVMLQRIKALKCVVFTQVLPSKERRFLGCASPENIRWALAASQPWLEEAYAAAYAAGIANSQTATGLDGALDGNLGWEIVRLFITRLKSSGAACQPPTGWIEIDQGTGKFEHASWLSERELPRIIGANLWRDAFEDYGDKTDEQKKANIKSAAFKGAPYVALLKDGYYQALIDRIALLSQIGQAVL
jgi:hypothetical protein